ncbi:MAG: hypothetical protein HY360_10320 [Verrucomicrobia bacterium]|nr:hypothetical protein [Verrucomicrobiota bacterium]
MSERLQIVSGQPSWRLRSDRVQMTVTRLGGHIAPVVFDRKRRRIQPFHVSPFSLEKTERGLAPILKVLRGDFFCLPFGGNVKPFRGERHSIHGEPCNRCWDHVSQKSEDGVHTLTLRMNLRVRRGVVTKRILLRDGEDAVYQEHTISGMKGPNCPGHHPNLQFRSRGRIAVSPFLWGSTYPHLIERPEDQSYCGLKPGVSFRILGKVPLIYGGESDLSIYPARRGFMDVIQIVADPKLPVAWNTVTFPEEGWLYFALRDPKVLRQTLMWFSNGGRYSPPWNGRHVNVLGLEDVTSYFGEGLPLSAQPNPWNKRGVPTALDFNPSQPTSIRYIMGIAPVPRGFTRVKDLRFEDNRVVFIGDHGRASARVDWQFARAPSPQG